MFTLVPSNFFDPARELDALKEAGEVMEGSRTGHIDIPQYDAVLVYTKDEDGVVSFTTVADMLQRLPVCPEYNKILCRRSAGRIYLAIAQGKQLLLVNAFDAADFTTAEYFIFLAVKSLQINPEVSTISWSGELSRTGRIGGVGPGQWYATYVEPLAPLAVRGFIWYQGENNCGAGDNRYAEKFKVMTDWWRNAFAAPAAPFYYVLLAPHVYSDRMHRHNNGPQTAETLPLFREQQKEAGRLVAGSEYVCITDLVDDINDIHPSYKWTVGARLARVALAKTYGRKGTEWSGPRFESVRADGGKLVVTFSHAADSLRTRDGKRVGWFEVAGSDGVFHPAVADISSDSTVVTYSPYVPSPCFVRYGWHEMAEPNLENSEGLPAVPFAAVKAGQAR